METFQDYGIIVDQSRVGEVATTCPKCSEGRKKKRDRCLSVNTEKGAWQCHHCGWAGGLKEGEQVSPSFVYRPNYVPQTTRASDPMQSFFTSRGIFPDTVARFKVNELVAWMNDDLGEVLVLAFPFYKYGEVVNIKYRGLDCKAFRQYKGAEKILFNVDSLVDQDAAIIVEGELDAMAIFQCGSTNVVSVPDGAPSKNAKVMDRKFEFLANCEEFLKPLKKIFIAVDNDEPGKLLEQELARRLGVERCYRVEWPQGCKDANDTLLAHGADGVREALKNYKPFPIEGVYPIEDLIDETFLLYQSDGIGGVSTGWKNIEDLYRVRLGEMTIVTGIPNHGKSQWLDALMVNLKNQYGWSFAICSPENMPLARHAQKLAELIIGKPFKKGPHERMTLGELAGFFEVAKGHFHFIAAQEMLTVDQVLKAAQQLVLRHNIQGLVLDPWNEFDHRRPAGMTETEFISMGLSKIRKFAQNAGVHVWVVAHPTKMQPREDGTYRVPNPWDISGSAHWRNRADVNITVFRDVDDQLAPVQIHVQKVRFKEVGKIGAGRLHYDVLTGRYYDFIEPGGAD